MKTRLVAALVACLGIGAGEPKEDLGRVRVDLAGSKWVVVRGYKGEAKLTSGSITFGKDGYAEVRLQWGSGPGVCIQSPYRFDPATGRGVIVWDDPLCLVGDRLRLDIKDFENRHVPPGRLWVIFEPTK